MVREAKISIGFLVLILSVLWFLPPAWAGVYKWVDEAGKVHYTNNKSKIPKKYRNQKDLKKVRTVGPDTGVQVEGSPSKGGSRGKSGGGAGGSGKGDQDPAILSEEEVQLVQAAMAHLASEIQFAQNHQDDMATPTSQRLFVNAQDDLIQKKEAIVSKLSATQVPVLVQVRETLASSLAKEKANPVAVRRMSVATAIDRMNAQVGPNRSLIDRLKEALTVSDQKKKELEEKSKQKEKADAQKKAPDKKG